MHVGAWVSVVGAIAGLAGCQAFDPSLLDESLPLPQSRGRDAGTRGAGAASGASGASGAPRDSDACAGAIESCNAVDDDCDGKVDEDADDCSFAHAIGACASAGTCVLAECEAGFLDCNARADDGCERSATLGCRDGTAVRDGGDVQVGTAGTGPVPTPEPDAAVMTPPPPPPPDAGPSCVASAELCNKTDDDCDGKVDEAPANCALDACIASAPSYRGARCDQCVCAKCAANVTQCQNNADAHWAMLCRDVTECYVTNSRANRCGNNEDCYGTGNGPCAGQVNLASGGSSATDTSKVTSSCTAATPPTSACSAVTQYRDQCTRGMCMTECAD